ncbi:hypothetical protein E4U10_004938 [Claviceps purpurea]|nr:hypothetical protein E4U10_004938 [Claviceps purpurea]
MVVFPPDKASLMEDAEPRHGEASGQLDLEPHGGTDARDTRRRKHCGRRVVQIICVIAIASWLLGLWHWPWPHRGCHRHSRPHFREGRSPWRDDPFHFIPCTNNTIPPALDDPYPEHTWANQYDPDPGHWSWGTATLGWEQYFENSSLFSKPHGPHEPHDPQEPGRPHAPHSDPYAGRGIYLCGYLDVPLDYTNKSDARIARLAVTKYQVSGLAGHDRRDHRQVRGRHGTKSERTIVTCH